MAMSLVSLANGCRLCLKIGPDNEDIFSYQTQKKKSLLQNIWKYFSIQVLMEDFFPKKICPRCIGEIERFTAFCAEVEQVQKRMQNMIACIPPDLHQNPTAQIGVPDFLNGSIKVENDIDIFNSTLLNGPESKKPVAYGILQKQPNNPNPVMSLLIVGDDPLKGANVQQFLNPNSAMPFVANNSTASVQNKMNNADVQPQFLSPSQVMPQIISVAGSNVQNTKAYNTTILNPSPVMPYLLSGSNLDNMNVQTQSQNGNPKVPIPALGGNSGVRNKKTNKMNVLRSLLKNKPIAPLPLSGDSPGVQNMNNTSIQTQFLNVNQLTPLLSATSNLGIQNNTNVQNSVLSTNQMVSYLAADGNLGLPNSTSMQTSILNSTPLLVTSGTSGVQNNVVNNTSVQTQFLNPNQMSLLPAGRKTVESANGQTESFNSTTLPLMLGHSDSAAHSKNASAINPETQYYNVIPSSPFLVIGDNSNVQYQKMSNAAQFLNPTPLQQLVLLSGEPNVQNYVNNKVALPLLVNPSVVGVSSEVQNEKISSTNPELSSEDSHCSRESLLLSTTSNSDNLKTEVQGNGVNNAEGGPDDIDYLKAVAAEAAETYCSPRDVELANFFNLTCFNCEEGEPFKKYSLLDKHSLAEHGKRAVIMCCNREFVGESSLIQHMTKHKLRVKCPECGKELSYRYSLKYHMLRHLPQERRPYKCKKCGKGFAMRSEVEKHQEIHLSGYQKKTYVCDICGKQLSTPYSVVNHQLYFHQRVQKAMCHICPKTFSTASALKIHLTSHYTKEQSEKCPECGKQLKNKMTLRTHMLLHSSKKTYPCPHCNKVCRFPNRLREHLRCHQDLWPHQCTFCQKLFKRKAGLQAHIVVHTGEQPYQCPYCSRTFASKSNYYSHKLRMHIRRNANKKSDRLDPNKADMADKKKTKASKNKKNKVAMRKKRNGTPDDTNSVTHKMEEENQKNVAGDTDNVVDNSTDNGVESIDDVADDSSNGKYKAQSDIEKECQKYITSETDNVADDNTDSVTDNIYKVANDNTNIVMSTTDSVKGDTDNVIGNNPNSVTDGNTDITVHDNADINTDENLDKVGAKDKFHNVSDENEVVCKTNNVEEAEDYNVADESEIDLADLKKYYNTDANEYNLAELNKYEMEDEEKCIVPQDSVMHENMHDGGDKVN